jgi:hypothetical protein
MKLNHRLLSDPKKKYFSPINLINLKKYLILELDSLDFGKK